MALLPLGLISQGGGAGGSGAFELISTAYGTGSSSSVTFSSIPSTYTHLQLRLVVYGTSNTYTFIKTRFNSDSATNYSYHRLGGNGTNAFSSSATSQNGIELGEAGGPGNGSSIFAPTIIDIWDYANTNKYKTVRGLTGLTGAGTTNLHLGSGLWMNTAAISSITVTNDAAVSWSSTSRFSLYGIRGA